MSSPILLDTSVVLFLARNNGPAGAIRQRHNIGGSGVFPFLSIVSVGEARVMAARRQWGENKVKILDSIINSCIRVPIFNQVIDNYVGATLFSENFPGGARNPGKNDLWIAATAKAMGATLITTDDDFSHFAHGFLNVEMFDISGKIKIHP